MCPRCPPTMFLAMSPSRLTAGRGGALEEVCPLRRRGVSTMPRTMPRPPRPTLRALPSAYGTLPRHRASRPPWRRGAPRCVAQPSDARSLGLAAMTPVPAADGRNAARGAPLTGRGSSTAIRCSRLDGRRSSGAIRARRLFRSGHERSTAPSGCTLPLRDAPNAQRASQGFASSRSHLCRA